MANVAFLECSTTFPPIWEIWSQMEGQSISGFSIGEAGVGECGSLPGSHQSDPDACISLLGLP